MMFRLSPFQKTLFTGFGILLFIVGVVLLVLSTNGIVSFPWFLAVQFVVSGVLLFVLGLIL